MEIIELTAHNIIEGFNDVISNSLPFYNFSIY